MNMIPWIAKGLFRLFALAVCLHAAWKILQNWSWSPPLDPEQHHETLKAPAQAEQGTPRPRTLMQKCAYAVLATNFKAVFPALVLLCQLEAAGSGADKIAVLPEALASRVGGLFQAAGFKVHKFGSLEAFPCPSYPVGSRSTRKRDQSLWNKLQVWRLTQYTKVISLDSDLLILSDVDELFDLDVELAGAPGIIGDEKVLFWDPPEPFETDPLSEHSWKNLTKFTAREGLYPGLNSGVLLMRPNATLYDELVLAASALESRTCCPTQEFLFRFFELRGQYHRLSPIYNMRKYHRLSKEEQDAWRGIKIYHFVERKKPWHLGRKDSSSHPFEGRWWAKADQADGRMLASLRQSAPDLLPLYMEAKHAAISNLDRD